SLTAIGVRDFAGLVPADVFNWQQLLRLRGIALIVGGGFMIGFGTAYAGGCTSGHGISGIADLQPASLVALLGFFAGGIAGTFLLLPLLV
ncbi:MAG TPA: YeeE/YedE thiosulfate transporter family protein, partial [Vicinamibacterales bacterium]|nr:YeeE/YedE thiosulfate transporter family protein [Vicinamibacterales bacterium]